MKQSFLLGFERAVDVVFCPDSINMKARGFAAESCSFTSSYEPRFARLAQEHVDDVTPERDFTLSEHRLYWGSLCKFLQVKGCEFFREDKTN